MCHNKTCILRHQLLKRHETCSCRLTAGQWITLSNIIRSDCSKCCPISHTRSSNIANNMLLSNWSASAQLYAHWIMCKPQIPQQTWNVYSTNSFGIFITHQQILRGHRMVCTYLHLHFCSRNSPTNMRHYVTQNIF
jgi:hypothetical protein